MKVYFPELELETTLEDIFQSIKPYDTFEEFKNEILENSYDDGYFSIDYSEGEFEASVKTSSFEVINYINNLEAAKDDQFILIIKDELTGELSEYCDDCDGEGYKDEDWEEECENCEGTGGYEELAYISFEAISNSNRSEAAYDDPPALKGGEYDKKTFMTEKQMNKYINYCNSGVIQISDCKYQSCYFVRVSKYDPKEWSKWWLENNNC